MRVVPVGVVPVSLVQVCAVHVCVVHVCVVQGCESVVCSSVEGILYLQFFQQFKFALHLSSSVGIISESIDEHLKKKKHFTK